MSVNIVVPELSESVVDATVAEWLKKEGEPVEAGEVVVILETDKVSLEVAAESSGVLARIEQGVEADVKAGEVLGVIEETANGAGEKIEEPARQETTASAADQAPSTKPDTAQRPETGAEEAPKATPVARRIAEARGIELADIQGSGTDGKITKDDVKGHVDDRQEVSPAPTPEAKQTPATDSGASPIITIGNERKEARSKMSRRRRTIARRLVEAQQTAAMLTTFNEIDMSAVIELRNRRKETFKEKHGVSLGFSSFFVKAAIGALKVFPQLNGEIEDDTYIILKNYYDIGIAIGAEEGLVVPVLRDADRMSFAEIEQTIRNYAQQAREGTLAIESLMGGTFTITNGGVFGSMLSTPILNPPQVGILGLHAIKDRPVALDGELTVRPIMYVALTYDHRIVDGREAVLFLVSVKELIEDPETLLIEG